MGIVDPGGFDRGEEVGWAEDVVDAAGTLGAPTGEVGFGGVVERGHGYVMVGGEVCECAIWEGVAGDNDICV